MFGRDKSERFKSQLPSPGPGDYNPAHPEDWGYKADPRSGFKGSGRFSASANEDGSGNMSVSPRRRIPSRPNSRTTDWTANRIKDLETELRISKAKVMELDQVIRESGMSSQEREELEAELHDIKNKLLAQKGSTAQAQRETIKVQGEKKKLENELANVMMKMKRAEESRTIAEGKVSEAKYKLTEMDKQMTVSEKERAESDEAYRMDIQALKKKLAAAEAASTQRNDNHDHLNTQLANARALSNMQQEQLSALEEELSASKAATESLISENLARFLVVKAQLTVAGEREAELDELVAVLRAEIADLKSRIEKALKEKADLEDELAKMRAENEEKVKQLAALKQQLEAAEAELKNRDQHVEELQSKLVSMENGQKTSHDALREAEATVETLRANLESKSRDVQVLKSKVDEITKSLGEQITEEEEQDLDRSIQVLTQAVKAQKEKLDDVETRSQNQAGELKHLGTKVATVLKEKKAKVGELERQKKEEKSLRRSLAEQENRINYLSQQVQTAETQMAEEAEARSNLQNELKMVRLQLGEKTVEAADLQQKAEDAAVNASSHQGDSAIKSETISKLQSELESAKKELAARQQTVQKLQKKVEEMGSNVGARGSELSSLQDQLNKVGSERDTLQSSLEACKKELADAKTQNKKKDDTVTSLKKDLAKAETKLAKAMESKKKAEETVQETLKEKDEVEKKLSRSKDAYKNVQSTLTSQTQELAKLGAEKRQLETQLDGSTVNTEKNTDQLVKKLQTAQEALKDREEEIRDIQAEMDNIARSTESAKGDSSRIQVKLAKAESELRHKTAAVQDLQIQVKALSQENTELGRRHDQEVAQAKTRVAEKEKRVQRLERELTQLREKLSDRSAEENHTDNATENELRALLSQQKKRYESQIRALKLEPTSIKELRTEVSAAQAVATSTRKQNETLRHQLHEVKERLAFFECTNAGPDDELDEVGRLKEALREAERKVSESQKLAAQYRHQLRQSDTIRLEMERLEQENLHLHKRSEQLNADVTGLMQSSGSFLGHHNNKQKIQYHLKLKTELEEMRQQYTILSREKFKLEQAIRYMAARADLMNGNPVSDVTGTGIRHPSASLAPASTKESVVLSTPTAKTHMKWTSRGRGTTKTMSAYKPRDSMERGIEETQIATVVETEAFKHDVSEDTVVNTSDPVIIPISSADSVENRILTTIQSIVGGGKRRRKGLYE